MGSGICGALAGGHAGAGESGFVLLGLIWGRTTDEPFGVRRAFTVADLEAQTAGVECRKDAGSVDEIPAAYKDVDEVIAAQQDLVEVVVRLETLISVKG